jgi:hypothetical protein
MLRRARPWDCACVCEREESVSPSVPPSSACERSAAVRARCLLPACPVSLSISLLGPPSRSAGWLACGSCAAAVSLSKLGCQQPLFSHRPSRCAFRLPPFFLPPLFFLHGVESEFFLRQDLLTFPLVFLILDAPSL